MFGDKLTKALNERGMSQSDFAYASGLTRACVCRLCHNERNPRYDTLIKVCRALEVSPEYFYSEKNTAETSL